jgi:hypothetical protein
MKTRTTAQQRHAADGVDALPLNRSVTLLEHHRQKRLFPTTIGGGA